MTHSTDQSRTSPSSAGSLNAQEAWHDGRLWDLLRSTSRLKMFLETSSAACRSFAILLGVALCAILIDAVLALSPAGRMTAAAIVAGCLLGAFAIALFVMLRNRFHPNRSALLIEERLNDRDNTFVNAVDFTSTAPGTQSPLLRERAIRIAEQRARDISSLEVVPFGPLYRAVGIAGAACLVWLLLCVLSPRLMAMVIPRFLDPYGDHPPYTLIDFGVRVTPAPALHGKPATISAALSGPEPVDQASVVFVEGEDRETLPMFRTGEQQFALEIERATQSRRFYIDTPHGRSQTQDLDVWEVPDFEDVQITYQYPEYTGWSPREASLDRRGLKALVGTDVTVRVRSNLPLEVGNLRLLKESSGGESGGVDQVPLTPDEDDPRSVRATFPLKFKGNFKLSLIATNGAESLEPLTGPLAAIPDRLPQVAIVQPAQHVVVVEDWTVPVAIEALDDVGVAKFKLYRSVNGWGPTAVELPFETVRGNAARAQAEFDLPALGARPGDVITYYASVWDNHPGGRQFQDSQTHVIQVISKEEYQQYARQQYQMAELISEFEAIREQLEQLRSQREEVLEELETLRQRMASSDEVTGEVRQRIQKLEEQLGKFSDAAAELAQKLEDRTAQIPLYELEEPYTDMLQRLSKQVRQQSENARQLAQSLEQTRQPSPSVLDREAFQQAAETFRREKDPFDEQTQQQLDGAESDLEMYRLADNLMAAAEQLRSVIARQREVADRLREFQNQDALNSEDQPRADRFASEQEQLEQQLEQTVQDLRQAAEQAQERLPQMAGDAMKLCEAIGVLKIREDQQLAAREARRGAGQAAQQAAESAAEKLESLLSDCPSCQKACNGMCDGMDGPLQLPKDRLEQCLNQLAQGRGIPGLPRPGMGSGTGTSSGQGGTGIAGRGGQTAGGTGEQARWRPGQSFPGSQAPVMILGPHTAADGLRPQQSGQRLGGGGRGSWIPVGSDEEVPGAELLTPEAREQTTSASGNLRGVPIGYRPAAQAYFERLAEEN